MKSSSSSGRAAEALYALGAQRRGHRKEQGNKENKETKEQRMPNRQSLTVKFLMSDSVYSLNIGVSKTHCLKRMRITSLS
jgi:hypothetical protein